MSSLPGFIAITLYLVCTLGLIFRLQEKPFATQTPILLLLAPGFAAQIFHWIALYISLISEQGLQLGVFNAASVIGAIITLIILLMSVQRQTEVLAVMVLPLTAIALILELTLPNYYFLPSDTPTGIQIHVMVSIVAYSLLGMAALMSLILAMQNRQLHKHHPGGLLHHLPPLQTMEKLLFDSIIAGFIGLSIALISGFAFLDDIFAQHLVHKTVLSIIAWCVFGTLLTGRLILGWRGRTAIRWTLTGFASLMLAYFGSKFVLEFLISS
ncbi:MAG: cytochrome c biogenesis protein CcsA [Gammaproteobacteria bacterium]|nr:cytochrome c biogenesis protein CcsA [Gammaproteobacteria bacterium]MDH5735235.1 cytochrome c biogenesis protein CcsA [Gammaproteobacteria bacterium]